MIAVLRCCLLVFAFWLGALGQVHAEPPLAAPMDAGVAETEFKTSGEPLERRRDRPKFDGVVERTTAGEVALWVPRVILFPLYLVSEYVVRRPIGWVVTGIEKHRILPKLRHYTTVGDPDGDGLYAGVDPIARFDTGFRFAVGLLFWAENLFGDSSELRLGVDSDFVRNATADLQWQIEAANRLFLTPMLRAEQRDDFRFYGIGADSDEESQTRFFRRKLFGGLKAEYKAPSPGIGAKLTAEISENDFDCSDSNEAFDICGVDHVINTDDDVFNPPGFDGYSLVRLKARLYADSRPPRPENGTGARAEVFARWGQGLSNSDIRFLRGGAEGALFWDVFKARVIGLRVAAETTLDSNEVPFAELILPGGPDVMRGFARGRMHGASMFVASLDYRYPIWSLADGTIFFETGNAFDDLSDLELDALRGSFGLGLRTLGSRHVSLDLLLAAGTTRFDAANFGIESWRLSVGTNWGF